MILVEHESEYLRGIGFNGFVMSCLTRPTDFSNRRQRELDAANIDLRPQLLASSYISKYTKSSQWRRGEFGMTLKCGVDTRENEGGESKTSSTLPLGLRPRVQPGPRVPSD